MLLSKTAVPGRVYFNLLCGYSCVDIHVWFVNLLCGYSCVVSWFCEAICISEVLVLPGNSESENGVANCPKLRLLFTMDLM